MPRPNHKAVTIPLALFALITILFITGCRAQAPAESTAQSPVTNTAGSPTLLPTPTLAVQVFDAFDVVEW